MSEKFNPIFDLLPKIHQLLTADTHQGILDALDNRLPAVSNALGSASLAFDRAESDKPILVVSGQRHVVTTPSLLEFTQEYQIAQSLADRFRATAELYPLRAAALSCRVLIMALADLFEEDKLHELDGALMDALIHCLHYTEQLMDGKCLSCSVTAQPIN